MNRLRTSKIFRMPSNTNKKIWSARHRRHTRCRNLNIFYLCWSKSHQRHLWTPFAGVWKLICSPCHIRTFNCRKWLTAVSIDLAVNVYLGHFTNSWLIEIPDRLKSDHFAWRTQSPRQTHRVDPRVTRQKQLSSLTAEGSLTTPLHWFCQI